MEEIENKVKKSKLIQLDLADFKPKESIIPFDLADILWQGLVLKEKDFREFVKNHDWSTYKDKTVSVFCSVDAIIPTWAYMLTSSKLFEIGAKVYVGTVADAEKELIKAEILKYEPPKDHKGMFIIKGCSDISCPEFAMSELTKHLIPISNSIMYGEPCSTVPVYKKKRK